MPLNNNLIYPNYIQVPLKVLFEMNLGFLQSFLKFQILLYYFLDCSSFEHVYIVYLSSKVKFNKIEIILLNCSSILIAMI